MTDDEKRIENFKETYGCSAEHFLEDEYSICREERQYAVLLYNVLRYYRKPERRETDEIKRIFKACCLEGAEVVQVFYEATFMRDFFERNHRIVLGKSDGMKEENRSCLVRFERTKGETVPPCVSISDLIRINNINIFR